MSSIHPRLLNEVDKSTPSPFSFLNLMATQSDGRSNLFPANPIINANFQHLYTSLLQQQIMQLASANNPGASTRDGSSPSHSEADVESPLNDVRNVKKVTVEEDGSAQCPLCEERLQEEKEWKEHVEIERNRLINTITNIKNTVCGEWPSKEPRRSGELARIRSNISRRRALKECLSSKKPSTPSSSSVHSLPTPSSDCPLTCCACQRSIEYGIVCSPSEGIRCQECFDVLRALRKSTPPVSTEESSLKDEVDCEQPFEKRVKMEE